jgi:uncharacterized protein YndB with AHSA1/START domain
MTTGTGALSVTKTVTVNASQERAFTVFTEKFFTWWPKAHHIGDADLADAIIEPKVGGRWFERGVDGAECDWGVVLAYDPPARVVLSWHLQGDWEYNPDPAKASEVEVAFIKETDSRTRVELHHRHIERHDMPEKVVAGIDSPGGWGGILAGYAEVVA